MTHHEARLLFNGGEVTLKSWKRRMPPEILSRELAAIAQTLFKGWDWTEDGEAGMAIEPTEFGSCMLLLIDSPVEGAVCL